MPVHDTMSPGGALKTATAGTLLSGIGSGAGLIKKVLKKWQEMSPGSQGDLQERISGPLSYNVSDPANLRQAIGEFSAGGLTDADFASARNRAQALSRLIGQATANRISQGYGARGIRSAGVLTAARQGAQAQAEALREMLTPLDVEAARSRIAAGQLGEGRGLQLLGLRGGQALSERDQLLQLLSILRRRGDILAGKPDQPSFEFSTPFGGISF